MLLYSLLASVRGKMAACALGAALTALLLLAGPGPAAATDDDGDDGRSCNRVAAAAGPVMTPVMEKFAAGEAWTNETLTCAADAAGSTACTFDNPSGWVDADGTAWINSAHSPLLPKRIDALEHRDHCCTASLYPSWI